LENRSHQLIDDLVRADADANVKEKDGCDPSK
jgi:hypothetical protein